MVRSVTTKARDAITNAARRSIKGVKSIAGDALGAAAKAAADVVLESTTNALDAGRAKIKQSTRTTCPTKDGCQKENDQKTKCQTSLTVCDGLRQPSPRVPFLNLSLCFCSRTLECPRHKDAASNVRFRGEKLTS